MRRYAIAAGLTATAVVGILGGRQLALAGSENSAAGHTFTLSGSVDGLSLASGGLLTGHADFVNAWEPEALDTEVTNCLHRLVVCAVRRG